MPVPNLRERVVKIAGRVFRVPMAEIQDTSSPETIASWDSLLHMRLVLALEEEFGVQFDAEEIVKMQRIDGILDILSKKT
jgi:acyl carrier protein